MDRYALYGQHNDSFTWHLIKVSTNPSTLISFSAILANFTVKDHQSNSWQNYEPKAYRIVREKYSISEKKWLILEVLYYKDF